MIESVLDALLEPAMLLDGSGRVSVANLAAQERLGVWVIGRSYVSVLRQPALLGPVEDAYSEGTSGIARFVHSSGQVETLFEVSISALTEAGEGTRHVLLVFRDVSDAHAGESMRRDFVANVSHELKTPLTAVSGFIETLQGPARNDAPARDRFLGMMAQETARMNRLVSDLLSLSRLEGQSRRRPTEVVDLVGVISETMGTLRPGADTNEVQIVTDLPDSAAMPADRDQIIQVITNLVENAIKYGRQPGVVTLSLAHVAREPVIKGPAWQLSVRDAGAGIAPEHIHRLTERFYRVDTDRSRAKGGTGLGLAIVKHIVNRHRGRLRIESVVGQGTEVLVTLPAA
ncbi:two-component system, OmpR family, phosphate regulon sensor histidine kinase PhoR [Jannaschia faecimaris]|uniref:histidine kinase n=1 Tax=Jannaschia faecimaris TaxID=1244108 RepID=A0A1H3T831_9RHOB|nr:ATP-binding protein [Jannaschia faecimaris]SDZ45499.1 two-component system, OmpR family, phosphate regulon sensor histidine kinase PhoR [Jannaschia faecimaris]